MNNNELPFFSRDLSWVEFNARILDEALQEDVPLLERLKFLTIVASNFDEFFMVRVANLKTLCKNKKDTRDEAGLLPCERIEQLSKRVQEVVAKQYNCLTQQILPGLAREGLVYIPYQQYTEEHIRFLESHFLSEILPILTPLRVSQQEGLPSIGNLKLHAAFLLNKKKGVVTDETNSYLGKLGVLEEGESSLNLPVAIVQIPSSLDRVVWLPEQENSWFFTLLDDVVQFFGDYLFPGFSVEETLLFKIARDADFAVDEDREEDFIAAMEEVLVSRQTSIPVRLVTTGFSVTLSTFLREATNLAPYEVYHVNGPIDLSTLVDLSQAEGFDHLRNTKWKHFWPSEVSKEMSIWDELKRTDILLHTPYNSWELVLRYINSAADDPDVLAIKMTLYRTSGDSPVVKALERAALKGKHVTVFVELKARFDEERNISWTRRLEESGVIVVHGIVKLKVHAKICLVIRKEPEGIKRYLHLSTGNYNDKTAKLYVDMSLFTCNLDFANDATAFFNMITGYSTVSKTKNLIMAPIELKPKLLSLIDRETKRAQTEKAGRIVAKMNSLSDPDIIKALYAASNAGVKIRLNVRGICMLVPGVKGVSENITVVSIVDRYLEHTRVYWFSNGGAEELYLSSADLMPRNLDKRVELFFPILQESIRTRILNALFLYFKDNTKAHYLQSDGSWRRRTLKPGEKIIRAQEVLYKAEKKRSEAFEKDHQREFEIRRS